MQFDNVLWGVTRQLRDVRLYGTARGAQAASEWSVGRCPEANRALHEAFVHVRKQDKTKQFFDQDCHSWVVD